MSVNNKKKKKNGTILSYREKNEEILRSIKKDKIVKPKFKTDTKASRNCKIPHR